LFTGIPEIDKATTGFRKGELVVLSGPPKNGKTTVCQTFTSNMVASGAKVLWFTYEVGYEDFFDKYPSTLDFYVPYKLESGNLPWVLEHIEKGIAEKGTEVVFIDHLDFLKDDDPNEKKFVSRNNADYVASIIKKIKRFAVEHGIVIFLMTHLKKNNWSSGEMPESDDLRDTGQIAQLADYVMFVVRKRAAPGSLEKYEMSSALLGIAENRRNGRTPKIPMYFDPEKRLFVEETIETWYKEAEQEKLSWEKKPTSPRAQGRA
jgi:replicative DNA helicase